MSWEVAFLTAGHNAGLIVEVEAEAFDHALAKVLTQINEGEFEIPDNCIGIEIYEADESA